METQSDFLHRCTHTLPNSLIQQLQKTANERTNGNRSEITKYYILLGMEAERFGFNPGQEARAATEG